MRFVSSSRNGRSGGIEKIDGIHENDLIGRRIHALEIAIITIVHTVERERIVEEVLKSETLNLAGTWIKVILLFHSEYQV